MLAHTAESIKLTLPTERDRYTAFVHGLDETTRLLLFGVPEHSVTFRCPTNGRIYCDEEPLRIGDTLWTKCYWCDTGGRVRGEQGFDRASPQPHANPIISVEETHAASQTDLR